MADARLRSLVERIETLEAEIAELNGAKRDIYAEAKGDGYDVPSLKAVISIRRKREKDPVAFDEHSALVDLYLSALGGEELKYDALACVHENTPPHDPETGEIIEIAAPVCGLPGNTDGNKPGLTTEEASHAVVIASQSQAKADVDGRGGECSPAEPRPESVRRLAAGRTAAATSERMDATGRRDAHLNSPERASERPVDGLPRTARDGSTSGDGVERHATPFPPAIMDLEIPAFLRRGHDDCPFNRPTARASA